MDSEQLPDVYVMSKFPNFVEELKRNFPPNVNLKFLESSDQRIRFDNSIQVQEEEIQALQDAEVLIVDSMFLSKLLYRLPNLKWAQCTWAGVEGIFHFVDKSKPKPNFILTRYVDPYLGSLMANYVIAQIINIERGFYELKNLQLSRQWKRPFFPNFRVLSDLTVGVLGAGKLGSTVSKMLLALGANVISLVKSVEKHISTTSNYSVTCNLSEVLERSDYVCNVLPSTSDTRGLLDRDILQQCKKAPVFINIGRGDVVKEETIIKALKEGWISKAVLDVFDVEPLPESSPLWDHEKVIITPHIGGIPRISESAKQIAENYKRYREGKALFNQVDWNEGY